MPWVHLRHEFSLEHRNWLLDCGGGIFTRCCARCCIMHNCGLSIGKCDMDNHPSYIMFPQTNEKHNWKSALNAGILVADGENSYKYATSVITFFPPSFLYWKKWTIHVNIINTQYTWLTCRSDLAWNIGKYGDALQKEKITKQPNNFLPLQVYCIMYDHI